MIEHRAISPKVFFIGLGFLLTYYLARELPARQTMVLGFFAGLIVLPLIFFGYEKWCFPLLALAFFWAGLTVPFKERGEFLRW